MATAVVPLADPRQAPPGADATPQTRLCRQALQPPVLREPALPERPSVLHAWWIGVERLCVHRQAVQDGLRTLGQSRRLPVQIDQVRRQLPQGSGAALGTAVLRLDRTLARLEATLRQTHQGLTRDLACARSLLTPKVLLQQARVEWDAGADPADGPRRCRERALLVNRLVALASTLHGDGPVPGIAAWVADRTTAPASGHLGGTPGGS